MPETTENYHRIPVSSGHGDHNIKTITISSDEGIKALYCVECKEVVTYLFDVDKWTMEEAKDWIEEHKEDSLQDGDSMDKKLDRRQKDIIGSVVRYKSYGSFNKGRSDDGSDDTEVFVRGFFTDDKMDVVGDIITKEATVDAVERWRKWGNIRTMHDFPSGRVHQIGETDGLNWNEVVTVPVDEQTKKLIEGGVLKAYSVGIIPREYRINEEALEEMEEGDHDPWFLPLIIDKYDMIEISYVDHPANYSATIGDVSTGKSKQFEHKAVLFKNSDLIGDVENMDKEKEIVEGTEQEEAQVDATEDVAENTEGDFESKSTEESDVEETQEAESAEGEAEVEKEAEESEEEKVEKSEDSEFDVGLAVREMKGQLDGIEQSVSKFSDAADSLADTIVERLLAELKPQTEDVDTATDVDVEESDSGVEEEDKSFSVDEIVNKVVDGLVEALRPEVSRSAKVVAAEESEEESGESVDKTQKYREMPRPKRLEAMRQTIAERYNR